jgi:peroxiredoxin
MGVLLAVSVSLLVLVVLGCAWVAYQLVRQNGRLLLRVEALEQSLHPAHAQATSSAEAVLHQGLPRGSPAPGFTLPDLDGALVSLDGFRGSPVLLAFFNPGCGFCDQMAPDLGEYSRSRRAEAPRPVIVSTGGADVNRALVERHGISCPVLLQSDMEVATRYRVGGTPMGYLVDSEGMIASDLAVGAAALMALVSDDSGAGGERAVREHAAGSNGHRVHRGNRPLADSRINRSGLRRGAAAPLFDVDTVDGGRLRLDSYRGQRVLLVFSDPDCGPCQALAPHLERLSTSGADLTVLMVSRGTLEANRSKVSEHGLSFPVGMQHHWEVSRSYATFTTPSAYLIDEDGVLESDVVSGVDAILGLVASSSAAEHAGGVPMT